MPDGWLEVVGAEEAAIWDRFETFCQFRPSMNPDHWPGIVEPVPSLTWDLAARRSEIGQEWRSGSWRWAVNADEIDRLVLTALRDCLTESEWIYVLDWQHPTYKCWPHRFDTDREAEERPVEVFPNGDYHAFVHPDLRWGTFGHPWEATLCVWGHELIAAVHARSHDGLTRLHRRDGTPIAPA
jgi:hypothetical protein